MMLAPFSKAPHGAVITFVAASLLVAAWWLFATVLPQAMAQVFLPTPGRILIHLMFMFRHEHLWSDLAASCSRIISSVTIGFICAVPVGIGIAISKAFEAGIEPISSALRYTPLTALIPLFMLKLGIGEAHKVTVLSLGIFVQILPIIVESIRGVEQNYVDIARSYGFNTPSLVRQVLLPRVLPALVDSLRAGFAIGWAYLILVEFWGAESGLGHRLWQGQRFERTDDVFACAIVVGFLGLASDFAVRLARRLMFPWERGRTIGAV
jgi:NitT/TauT family transport system permease protein